MTVEGGITIALFVYVVAAFGLAYVLGQSAISKPLREWAFDFGLGRQVSTLEPSAAIKVGSTHFTARFYPLRWLVLLVECPACCGYHIGFWLVLVAGHIMLDASASFLVLASVSAGCFTAASNFILGRATGLIGHPKEHE